MDLIKICEILKVALCLWLTIDAYEWKCLWYLIFDEWCLRSRKFATFLRDGVQLTLLNKTLDTWTRHLNKRGKSIGDSNEGTRCMQQHMPSMQKWDTAYALRFCKQIPCGIILNILSVSCSHFAKVSFSDGISCIPFRRSQKTSS